MHIIKLFVSQFFLEQDESANSQVFPFWSTEEFRFPIIFLIDHLKKLDHRLHMELDLQS
jgi:hypothetical protein